MSSSTQKHRRLTGRQQEVLSAMVWAGQSWPMTTSEIAARVEQRATTAGWSVISRSSVADHLNALLRKERIEIVSDGPPRKWKAL